MNPKTQVRTLLFALSLTLTLLAGPAQAAHRSEDIVADLTRILATRVHEALQVAHQEANAYCSDEFGEGATRQDVLRRMQTFQCEVDGLTRSAGQAPGFVSRFWRVWQAADQVEQPLYAVNMQSTRDLWDGPVCGTLRELKVLIQGQARAWGAQDNYNARYDR